MRIAGVAGRILRAQQTSGLSQLTFHTGDPLSARKMPAILHRVEQHPPYERFATWNIIYVYNEARGSINNAVARH